MGLDIILKEYDRMQSLWFLFSVKLC